MPKRNALQCPNISVYTSCRKIVISTVPKEIRTKLNNKEQSIVKNSIPRNENFAESDSKLSQKSNKNKEYLQPGMENNSVQITLRTLQLNRSQKNTLTMSQSKVKTFLMQTEYKTCDYMDVPVMTPTIGVPAQFVYDVLIEGLTTYYAQLNEDVINGVAGIWDVSKIQSKAHSHFLPFFFFLSPSHTHTHTASLSLSLTHTYTVTLTHSHTYTVSLSLSIHCLPLPHSHTHTHTLLPSLSLTHTHTLSLPPSHTHTHCFPLSLSPSHTHTLSLPPSHTHTLSLAHPLSHFISLSF
jgi:hypothetical protein